MRILSLPLLLTCLAVSITGSPVSTAQAPPYLIVDQSAAVRKQGVLAVAELVPQNRLRGTFVIDGDKADAEVFFTLTPEAEPLIQQLQWKIID